jgi:23S rRNA pseudouridine1911/1915/1917 synthase
VSNLQVLYEDNHLIAVRKEAGLLVQGDKSGDVCLLDQVREYIREKYNKPGNVFVGLLHRLDRPVEGIVLFAKTSKGASRLSEQIRGHSFEKSYTALVSVWPKEDSAKLVHYLLKNEVKNKSWAYDEPVGEAKMSVLEYKVIQQNEDGSALLEIDLETGRHHQIRAQLAAIGCPIVGDSKYGSKLEYKKGLICLAATGLKFKKATSDEVVELKIQASFA